MAKPTRTIGPLHLEDLEPHRFEDLARQLLYDFRPWRQLEATGRSGSDDGFDARGYEIVATDLIENGEEDNAEDESPPGDRQWLIQCKREKAISPKKLDRYIDELPPSSVEGTYGIVLIAACDFSLTARNVFRDKVRERGFVEGYLWGRGEIEDMLFQPKNDHLLFAYFGVSLQTRKRALKTDVRARLATKRKASKVLRPFQNVLIRDASDERFPHLDPDETKDRFQRGRWRVMTVDGVFHDGVRIKFIRHLAFLSEDTVHWDFAETYNHARPHEFDDPWASSHPPQGDRFALSTIWENLAEEERGWFEASLVLPFENIIAIDEDGDDVFKGPHIYTAPSLDPRGQFLEGQYVKLTTYRDDRAVDPEEANRVVVFPRKEDAIGTSQSLGGHPSGSRKDPATEDAASDEQP